MRDNVHVKLIEMHIKKHFAETLLISPVNSMTPFVVATEDEEDKEKYMFILKAESWLYEPLQGQSMDSKREMGCKAYMEGDKLIFGFMIEPDIDAETEIHSDKIVDFLERLYHQDTLTVVVIDHITMNVVWVTNDFAFGSIRDKFNPFFQKFGII
jgi:hypothetical protein